MAKNGMLFLFGIPLIAAWGLASAAGQSIMTRRVSVSEQGQLQGALGSLASLAALFGPGLFTLIYARSVEKESSWNLPGAAWMFSTLMLCGAAMLLLRVVRSDTMELCEDNATV
jgi:DHA1 family tetracycline resistance protein-like MFS transporter